MPDSSPNATDIRSVGPIYTAAVLEEAWFFAAADAIAARFQAGSLPIGAGSGGRALYRYWKQRGDRIPESDRKNLYARVIGRGKSDAAVEPNREFEKLWRRFLTAVTELIPDETSSDPPVDLDTVRQAGRDLAVNLTAHGAGFPRLAARDLAAHVRTIESVLSTRDVQSAFGVRDMWEVVENVARSEFKRTPNTARARTLAGSGTGIIEWLARNAPLFDRPLRPTPRMMRDHRRLADACRAWAEADKQPEKGKRR